MDSRIKRNLLTEAKVKNGGVFLSQLFSPGKKGTAKANSVPPPKHFILFVLNEKRPSQFIVVFYFLKQMSLRDICINIIVRFVY
jgi:hypothetical protein